MPTAAEYLRPDLIAQVQRLDLRARFIVEGFYAGLHASPYHGFSVEFSEHRRYAAGDDLRTIDWNVFAKTDRFYVKKYRAETNLDAYVLIDTSASMAFPTADQIEPGGTARMSKFDYSVCLAAALGHMTVHQQDAIGLGLLGDGLRHFVAARSSRAHLMRILGDLASARPAAGASLPDALHGVAARLKKRGLLLVFSDMLAPQQLVIDAIRRLRHAGHDVIVFCVLDLVEATFPFFGPVRFEDVESPAHLTGDAAGLRAGYLVELERFTGTYRDALLAIKADFAVIHNAMSFDAALVRFLADRQGRF